MTGKIILLTDIYELRKKKEEEENYAMHSNSETKKFDEEYRKEITTFPNLRNEN